MGRPKQFEADEALRSAGQLFHRKGYGATSIADLEVQLGIGRKSLYDTFGDKRQLFLRILDWYIAMPYPISAPDAGLTEIERMFLESPSFDPTYRACLLANTTLEFGTHEDAEVALRIERHLARLEMHFGRALERAIASRDIPPLRVGATARYLTSSFQGIAVMARGGASRETLKEIVEIVLSTLRRGNA